MTGTVEEQKHVHKKNQELNVGIHFFPFFHSPFSFVTKDGTGCVGRVGWPQKIFNPPYPDLKAGHPVP